MYLAQKSYRSVLLLLLFALVVTTSTPIAHSENTKNEEKSNDAAYVFERIENVEMNKNEIIAHSAAFIAEKFVSAKSVIQLKDPELGKIVGDVVLMNSKAGFFDAFKGIKGRLILDAKDGKYRGH